MLNAQWGWERVWVRTCVCVLAKKRRSSLPSQNQHNTHAVPLLSPAKPISWSGAFAVEMVTLLSTEGMRCCHPRQAHTAEFEKLRYMSRLKNDMHIDLTILYANALRHRHNVR
jgi:hypothetical protein